MSTKQLTIDKSNGNVKYNDEKHVYWEGDNSYMSVTTLIGKYGQPYDEDFWSSYKAVEKLIPEEFFKVEKVQLLDTHKFNLKYFLKSYDFTEEEFNITKKAFLQEWADNREASCERGTKIHAELEHKMYENCNKELKKYGFGGKFESYTNAVLDKSNIDLNSIDRGVFPEFLIYRKSDDGILRIAGQIDLLIKDGDDIYIFDYKTNKKLDKTSYFDKKKKSTVKMQYPLNRLDDCNYMHYTMQLSTYAWMIQKLNPKFNIKKLMLIHYDHEGNVSEHVVNYLKTEVESMLRDWKRKIVINERAAKRKRIEF